MSGKLVLQIYEDDVPLTLIGTAKVIMGLKDEQIREVANSANDRAHLPKYCNNKEHHHYNACIGGGICLAKKYKRLFSFVDVVCTTCDSYVIVDTLNYMFSEYYEGKYRAEWRKTRRDKRSGFTDKPVKAVTKKRAKKQTETEPIQAPAELKTESITKKDSPKKKRERPPKLSIQATETGRVSGITPNESNKPKTLTKAVVERGKPRVKQGRPKKRTAEAA
jgi:hypothetical protein